MTEDHLELIRTLLVDAGYETEPDVGRLGVLGENSARVVWAVVYAGVTELLSEWEAEQAWLVEYAGSRVSIEKTWELYLVLACGQEPDGPEAQALEGIRRDASYARKVVAPGLDDLAVGRLNDYLAPLRDLPVNPGAPRPNALSLIEDAARQERNDDALAVLSAFRENRPLLEDL